VIAPMSGPRPGRGRAPDWSRCPREPAPCPAAASRGPPGGMTAARRLPAPELPVGPAATHNHIPPPVPPPPDYRLAAGIVKDAW